MTSSQLLVSSPRMLLALPGLHFLPSSPVVWKHLFLLFILEIFFLTFLYGELNVFINFFHHVIFSLPKLHPQTFWKIGNFVIKCVGDMLEVLQIVLSFSCFIVNIFHTLLYFPYIAVSISARNIYRKILIFLKTKI